MKFLCPMMVVNDISRSKAFYQELLEETVAMDLGANVTFTSGLAIQEKSYWANVLLKKPESEIRGGSDNFELYYEVEDLDVFLPKLNASGAEQAHPVMEQPWGQRVTRFYDPDHHLIEVGESMEVVIKRFFEQGMTPEQIAEKTGYPVEILKTPR